jgi:OmcA/MtrC family decaheme c-type cytochrome
VKDKSGAPVPLNQLENVSLVMAGPTSDYGYTSFGSDVTTPGFVSGKREGSAVQYRWNVPYVFVHAIPAAAKGSFAIGIESRRTETLLPGTTTAMEVRYGAVNKVFYFSVDGSLVQPRRTVAQTASCNKCHFFLNFHGDNRNQVEMCVLCHNPSLITTPDDPKQLAAGVSYNLMVHRIHSSYKSYADVRYPAMSPTGAPRDTRNCAMCHVNESQATPAGILDVLDPQGYINPVKPFTASCIGPRHRGGILTCWPTRPRSARAAPFATPRTPHSLWINACPVLAKAATAAPLNADFRVDKVQAGQ